MAKVLRRVVVTGASGFIGQYLLTKAVSSGIDVVALSRRGTKRRDVVDVRVDDYENVDRLASYCAGAQAVIHLAGRAHQSAGDTYIDDEIYRAANVESAVNVAIAARISGAGRFVFISSIGVNGSRTEGRAFTADDAPRPLGSYAMTKWSAEQAVARELGVGATDYVILRPPLVYGAGCPGNFARLLRVVAVSPIVPLGAIRARRTLIYVENLVDAILVAARHPGASRATFTIADDRTLSVGEIVRVIAMGLERSPRVVLNVPRVLLAAGAYAARRPEALSKLTAELLVDATEFSRVTGWVAPFSPEEALQTTARRHGAG